MFSSKFLLALAFSIVGARATEQPCTFYLLNEDDPPADPATSIHTAIYTIFADGYPDVIVNSNVTGTDPYYTAVTDIIVDGADQTNLEGLCQTLAGVALSDGANNEYYVEETKWY